MTIICLPFKRRTERLNKRRDTDLSSFGDENDISERKSEEGSVEQHSNTSQSTIFLETNKLPDFRHGIRITPAMMRASCFVQDIIEDRSDLSPRQISERLRGLGFSNVETEILTEVLSKYILLNGRETFSFDKLQSFFGYFFDKVDGNESLTDFAFSMMDLDSSGEISKKELNQFLNIFWNGSIENIQKTQYGAKALKKFMCDHHLEENLDFYNLMKRKLNSPFIKPKEFNEIRTKFIEEDASQALNLPSDLRQFVLNYKEEREIANVDYGKGKIKSSVFRNVAFHVKNLMEEQVMNFLQEELESEKLAEKILTSVTGKKEIGSRDFTKFLIKNPAITAFINDFRNIIVKADALGKVSLKQLRKEEVKVFPSSSASRKQCT